MKVEILMRPKRISSMAFGSTKARAKDWAITSLTPCSRISTPYRFTPASIQHISVITGFFPNDSPSPFTIAWPARQFEFMPFLTADGTRHGFAIDYHRPRTSASNATPGPLCSTGGAHAPR